MPTGHLKKRIIEDCPVCKNPFYKKNQRHRFCSARCQFNDTRKYKKQNANLKCKICNGVLKGKQTRYCSVKCYKQALYLKTQEYKLRYKERRKLKRDDRDLLKKIKEVFYK